MGVPDSEAIRGRILRILLEVMAPSTPESTPPPKRRSRLGEASARGAPSRAARPKAKPKK